jgi:uncharacterized protein (DUF849 family)
MCSRSMFLAVMLAMSSPAQTSRRGGRSGGYARQDAALPDLAPRWEPQALERSRDFIFRNAYKDVEYILKEIGEGYGTRYEFECYDVGHLYISPTCSIASLLQPPLFVQLIFGILGGIGTDTEDLMHMKRTADRLFGGQYLFSILAAGRHQMRLGTIGAIMGGNVRVGLEDSIYLGKGELARSNAEQVSKIRGILEALSLEPATPDEARA